MSSRQIIIASIASAMVIFLLVSAGFEIEDVPDLKWNDDFSYHSKQPYGSWIFHELIQKRFGEDVLTSTDTSLSEFSTDGNLYIVFGQKIYLDDNLTKDILNFLRHGNKVLFISSEVNGFTGYSDYSDAFSGFVDSVLLVTLNDGAQFRYIHYQNTFKSATMHYFSGVSSAILDSTIHTPLAWYDDGTVAFDKWEMEGGWVYWHCNPYLFGNVASQQEGYLEHFNSVFAHFEPRIVIMDHASFLQGNTSAESPLQFILETKPLRAAYYTILLTCLVYIIFEGKRRQRIIPTQRRNRNTSIEYIETLSALFEAKRHNHLVEHLREIFYNYVKERYHIDRRDHDFLKILTLKSEVEPSQIDELMYEFEQSARKLNVGDVQLLRLHKYLETFYQNCK